MDQERGSASATSYWELKLKERLMESAVMASATTEGGGRAVEQKQDQVQSNHDQSWTD